MSPIFIATALILCLFIYLIIAQNKQDTIKISDESIPLSNVLPIHSIEDDFIINGNGDISVGYKIFLPEVFTFTEEENDAIHLGFENLLKILPPYSVVHQQTFVYTDNYKVDEYSDNYLHMSNLKNLKGTETINLHSYIYISFINKGCTKNPQGTSLLKKAGYPFSKPFGDLDSRLKEIEGHLLAINSSFDSIEQITADRMCSAELNNIIYDYINLSYNTPCTDATKLVVDPIGLTDSGDLKIGNNIVNHISLVEEGLRLDKLKSPKTTVNKDNEKSPSPKINSKSGMIFPLTFGLPFDHIVNTVIEVTNNEEVISALLAEKTSLNMLANFYRPAKEKQAEIDLFIEALSQNNYQTSYTAMNVIVHDVDKANLSIKSSQTKQGFSNMNQSTSYVENQETANLFFCNIPGNGRANYRGFTNITKQAICYINKESLYLSPKTGHLFSDRFGNPVRINMWKNILIDNRNKVIIGPSGSGKSYFINNYALQSFIQGNDTMIIDIGGSFKNLIKINGGKYFDSREKRNFSFNPFLCQKDGQGNYIYNESDEDGEGGDDLVETIATIILLIWKKNMEPSTVEEQLIKDSIKAFFEYVNKTGIFPCLNAYKEFIRGFQQGLKPTHQSVFNVEDIELLLTPYTGQGEYAYLLNSEETINIVDDNLIAYDMENVSSKTYFPIVAVMVLSVIIEKIKRRRGIPKTLIIDEALNFLVDKKFGNFIAYLYRTFRKKEGEIIIAAQNVEFISNADKIVQQSILANADTKIILEHGEKNLPQVKALSILGIIQDEQNRILSLTRTDSYREFFVKMGNRWQILRNGVSPEASVAFDSKESTVVRIEQLFKETGSIPAAISSYIEEKGNVYK